MIYVEQEFEHSPEQREKVLVPVLYLPRRYDNPLTRDGGLGLFSSEGIELRGESQDNSTLLITCHLSAQGKVVLSTFNQLSQQRRVAIEIRKAFDTTTESRYFGLSKKTRTTEHEIEVAIPQSGNTIKASGLEITDVTHLHQRGVVCEIGKDGVHAKVTELVQTPLMEVGIAPHRLKVGSSKTVTQEPKLIPHPNVIHSQGPVSLEAERAHIYLDVNGQRVRDGSGPVKAQYLTFEQIEEQLAAAQRCRDAMEKDMRRTAKRKQTQGLVKAGITTALTFYLGPQVGSVLGASGIFGGNALALAVAKGAVMGFVNSVIMEQNPIKGALTGVVFEAFATKNVIVQALATTAIQGGDPLKNIIRALGTQEIASLAGQILPFGDQAVVENLIHGMATAVVRGGRPEEVWMALSQGLGKSLGSAIGDKVVVQAQEVRQEKIDRMAEVRRELFRPEALSSPAQPKQPKASPAPKERLSNPSSRSGQPDSSNNPFRLGAEGEVLHRLGSVPGSQTNENRLSGKERKLSAETDRMIPLVLGKDTPPFSLTGPRSSKQTSPSVLEKTLGFFIEPVHAEPSFKEEMAAERRKDLLFSYAVQHSRSGPREGSTFGKSSKLNYLSEASSSKDPLVTNQRQRLEKLSGLVGKKDQSFVHMSGQHNERGECPQIESTPRDKVSSSVPTSVDSTAKQKPISKASSPKQRIAWTKPFSTEQRKTLITTIVGKMKQESAREGYSISESALQEIATEQLSRCRSMQDVMNLGKRLQEKGVQPSDGLPHYVQASHPLSKSSSGPMQAPSSLKERVFLRSLLALLPPVPSRNQQGKSGVDGLGGGLTKDLSSFSSYSDPTSPESFLPQFTLGESAPKRMALGEGSLGKLQSSSSSERTVTVQRERLEALQQSFPRPVQERQDGRTEAALQTIAVVVPEALRAAAQVLQKIPNPWVKSAGVVLDRAITLGKVVRLGRNSESTASQSSPGSRAGGSTRGLNAWDGLRKQPPSSTSVQTSGSSMTGRLQVVEGELTSLASPSGTPQPSLVMPGTSGSLMRLSGWEGFRSSGTLGSSPNLRVNNNLLSQYKNSLQPRIKMPCPAEIYYGFSNLSKRQAAILKKLPKVDSYILIKKSDFNVADLATLTAKTGDEFAMFTLGSRRLIVRGDQNNIYIRPLMPKLIREGWTWSAHTHPGITPSSLIPSGRGGDRAVLELMNQEQSLILNSTGKRSVFGVEEGIHENLSINSIKSRNNKP